MDDKNRKKLSGDKKIGILFTAPTIAFLVAFIFVSIIYCLYLSFFEWSLFDLGKTKEFVGMSNYAKIFEDEIFMDALANTLTITAVCLLVETILGFLIALTLWSLNRQFRLVQTIILLPMIMAPVIVSLIWRYIYDPQFGMLNYLLGLLFNMDPVAWLATPSTALFSVILVDIWQMTPFTVLIMFAAMMGISKDCIEAAKIDGAGFWKIVTSVIIPSVLPMLFFVLLMRSMDLMKIFDTIYVLTNGGPLTATETLSMYTYKVGFVKYDMGYSMALSIVTLIIIVLICLVINVVRTKISERVGK